MQGFAVKAVNQAATLRNWIIGGYIIEYEQYGSDRATYGDRLIENLSKRINKSGLGSSLLRKMRAFYTAYPSVGQLFEIRQTVSVEFDTLIRQTLSVISSKANSNLPLPANTVLPTEFSTPAEVLVSCLSFSHIIELLSIEDPLVRFFYETECIKGVWSVRELRRQIATNLHVRIGLSADKMKAMQLADSKAERQSASLQIRDPYTFEFLGLKAKDVVTESDIEEALILHLQEFLLEMGKGFCFEARQKRIIIDGEYYFADLVFYNRLLHCSVIVEIKNDVFRHEHIGQLNAYVSYYTENEMQPGDNPPVGILLCTQKGKKMVEYALGNMDNQLFVSIYQLQLPDRQQLEQFIIDECQNQ
ncbi:PDDEXK nuclease domain-containing protein [Parabacteroides johnsonii]|uniref:PDDEXK nuclease domain-containing protein n=1 Tax=Parabacteroides johnsonii TaxID=387661 RepID=UPI003C6DF1A9